MISIIPPNLIVTKNTISADSQLQQAQQQQRLHLIKIIHPKSQQERSLLNTMNIQALQFMAAKCEKYTKLKVAHKKEREQKESF